MADIVGGRPVRELRVIDLKKELEARSLSKTGSKKDLVERLRNYLAEQEKTSEVSSAANVPDERGDGEKSEAKNNKLDAPRAVQEDSGDGEVLATHHVRAQDGSADSNEGTPRYDRPSRIIEDGSPPVKKQRKQSTSTSSSPESQHRSRSSSRELHRSRSSSREHLPSDTKATAVRARSSSSTSLSSGERSRSHSESRGRSRSRSPSTSPSRLRDQSKPRSRSQSESSSQSRTEEPATKSTECVARPKESAMTVDDSYHTAPEDMSLNKVDQSFVVEKIEESEGMEVEDGVFENKSDVKRDSEETGQEKTGATEDDSSAKTQNTCNKENEVKRDKPARKRRWGSRRTSSKSSSSINISTDSLKNLIPDINTNVLKSESLLDLNIHAASDDLTEDDKPDVTQKNGQEKEERTDVKIKRTVLQEVKAKEIEGDESRVEKKEEGYEQTEKETVASAPVAARRVSKTARASVTGVFIDEPEAARRSPSPARNPVNKVIHLRNLVRPYTILQLQELLRRSGTLLEGGFWIDKVKSHCFVTYETEAQATAARQSLHGTRWPSSNPKILRVEYASEEELDFYRTGKVAGGPAPVAADDVRRNSHKEAAPVQRHDSDEGTRKMKLKEAAKVTAATAKKAEPIREWDRDKVRQSRERSREREVSKRGERRRSSPTSGRTRSRERTRKEEKQQDASQDRRSKHDKKERKDEEEVPAKLLDDLFRKTKATPCIYWLPLTDELIAKRATERKQREEEREKRRKLMEKEEEEGRERAREERLKTREHDRSRENERGRDDDRTRRDSRHRY